MSLFSPALLVGIPLVSAAVLLLLGKRSNAWGHFLGTAASIASFGVAVAAVMHLVSQPVGSREINQTVWNWFTVGNFSVDVTLSIDALSGVFILLITGVGSLIHIYSIGYMSHDENRRKFFAYLNLFIAAMLLLVLANNFLLLYVGWEGVGLASFLLIGFWQHKNSASTAANKAFILNRVGDFGLAAAVMLMFVTFGSVSFPTVFAHVGSAPGHTTTWIALALLLAACGKSAQFPLQSWLLDAMEGPTPVSALIHAATMVTAGVYL
ncbi:MAG: proton-conducting transporter membrane subunit, partial [Actinomycetes bacterium]